MVSEESKDLAVLMDRFDRHESAILEHMKTMNDRMANIEKTQLDDKSRMERYRGGFMVLVGLGSILAYVSGLLDHAWKIAHFAMTSK